MSAKNTIINFAENIKAAIVTALATVATGTANTLKLFPDDFIADLATLIGIILSLVLIYTHWRKGRAEYKKTTVETDILKAELAEMRKKTSS